MRRLLAILKRLCVYHANYRGPFWPMDYFGGSNFIWIYRCDLVIVFLYSGNHWLKYKFGMSILSTRPNLMQCRHFSMRTEQVSLMERSSKERRFDPYQVSQARIAITFIIAISRFDIYSKYFPWIRYQKTSNVLHKDNLRISEIYPLINIPARAKWQKTSSNSSCPSFCKEQSKFKPINKFNK